MPGWKGGRDVKVAYRHPVTGETVQAATYVWHTSRLPKGVGPVDLEVSRSNPDEVVVAGDRFPATTNLSNYAPWTLFPFLVWGVRRWTLRRTQRLMASDAVTYLMSGAASPPSWWGRSWRLHLYPLDAERASPAVCSVPLIDAPDSSASFIVEAKGTPAPYGRVVARRPDGEVLWPSGRALRSQGRPAAAIAGMVPPSADKAARRLLIAGVALVVVSIASINVGTYAGDVHEREQVVTATVTGASRRSDGRVDAAVSYVWSGHRYSGTVTEVVVPQEGQPLRVRVDPQSPTRVWSTTQDIPPGTHDGELAGLAMIVALALLAAAGIAHLRARRPLAWSGGERAWRGLGLIDGRLWYGRLGGLTRRPRARFDPDALVLVEPDGTEAVYDWDNHASAAAPAAATEWHLKGIAPGQYNGAEVWLHVGRQTAGHTASIRLAEGGWRHALWEELPPLAAYLAATPAARVGLADPQRTASLIEELATRNWRRPPPPAEPLFGDPLDLHLAVSAVADRHVRRFAGHPVRGEPVPPTDQLVAEIAARLPEWVRPRVGAGAIADRLSRHLATGPWPFDVLLAGDVEGSQQAG